MADDLMTRRQRLQAEIRRRRAKGENPVGFERQLAELNAQRPGGGQGGGQGAGSSAMTTPGVAQPGSLGVGARGQIDAGTAANTITDAAANETAVNFNLNNPGLQTDAFGNTQQVTRNPDGTVSVSQGLGQTGSGLQAFVNSAIGGVKPLDLSGAPQILTDNDLMGTRQSVYDSLYGQATQNLERDRAREMEEQKQELANRGISYQPGDPESAYGKAVGAIDEKYRTLDRQAQDAANAGADSRLSTLAGINNTANQAFVTNALAQSNWGLGAAQGAANIMGQFAPNNFSPYQGGQFSSVNNLMQILTSASAADLSKYGIDQDTMAKLRQIAASNRGGGGGGAADTGPIIGGAAPGFGV